MPHGFVCPKCGNLLPQNYSTQKLITAIAHGSPRNCPAIDNMTAIYVELPNPDQVKKAERKANQAKNQQRKLNQNVTAFKKYQTWHKNEDIQHTREKDAATLGKGHGSEDKSSGMNDATKRALAKINRK